MIRSTTIIVGGLWAFAGVELTAQQVVPADTTVITNPSNLDLSGVTARKAVQEGNRLLIEGHAAAALQAYEHAKGLRPEALEIPFVEGLAHFVQKEYDLARDAFQQAARVEDGRLANDALYSIGTTYHAEAFENLQDPKATIERLENAMHRYRDVLADRPDHEAARDANFKAASMRRRLLQVLEEQQQQKQPQDQECDKENQDQQDQQNQQSQEQDEKEQDEEQQSQQASESEQQQEEQQQASPQEEEQRESREQAERRLREMMQAIRDRQKLRREEIPKIPVAPVEKDW